MPNGVCQADLPVTFFEYRIDAPPSVEGDVGEFVRFDALVELRVGEDLPEEVRGAEAWTVAIALDGCEASSVSVAAALEALDPVFCSLAIRPIMVPTRAISASFVLDFQEPVGVLPPAADPFPILDLVVDGRIGGQCHSCEIRFDEDIDHAGRVAENRITAGQRGYRPSLRRAIVDLDRTSGCGSTRGSSPYVFTFEGPSTLIATEPEADLSVEIATITVSEDQPRPGAPEAWSLAIRAENATIESASFPEALPLSDDGWWTCSLCDDAGGGRQILTAAVVMDLERSQVIPGEAPWHVLDLALRSSANSGCQSIVARFEDGLSGAGLPVDNLVTVGQRGFAPTLESKTIAIRSEDAVVSGDLPFSDEFTFSVCEPTHGIRLSPPTGSTVFFEALGGDTHDAPAIFVRRVGPASPSRYDARSLGTAARQTLALTSDSEELWVTLVATGLSESVSPRPFNARIVDFEVADSRPRVGARGGRIGLTVRGAGFVPGETSFQLEREGFPPIRADENAVAILSSHTAEVLVSLGDAELGVYDLVAEHPDLGRRELPGALEVSTPQEVYGVDFRILGPDLFRRSRRHTFLLEYTNVGNEEVELPFVRITPPSETEVGLAGEIELSPRLVVAATDAGGFAGRLAPGARGVIPIQVSSELNLLGDEFETFQIDLVTPLLSDLIDWDRRLRELEELDSTAELAAALKTELGSTWSDYAERMAEVATRLGRRGDPVFDSAFLFRYAARRALGRPGSAIIGRVLSLQGAGLEGLLVGAFEEGRPEPVSSSRTGPEGGFALDWLREDVAYTVRVSGRVESTSRRIPVSGADVYGVELRVGPDEVPGEMFQSACGNCDETGLPASAIEPPETLNTPIASWDTQIVGSFDPNDKVGPRGRVRRRRIPQIPPNTELTYTIYMENLPQAGAPASVVVVTDDLDPSLDPASVRFLDATVQREPPVVFSGYTATDGVASQVSGSAVGSSAVAPGAHGQIDVSHEFRGEVYNLTVDISAIVDLGTGRITWTLTTIDRDFPEKPRDFAGFLLPNDEERRGEASVTFAVRQRRNLPGGRRIRNRARIKFDEEKPIKTSVVLHEVNYFLPAGLPEKPAPADGAEVDVSPGLSLGWQAEDAESFDVVVRRVTPPGPPMTQRVEAPRWRPLDGFGPGVWEWQVTARNILGEPTTGPVWRFKVREDVDGVLFRRGDVDSSGVINISDPIALLGYLFLGTGEPICLDAGDADDDGAVNITDAVRILAWLFSGGAEPAEPFQSCGSDLSEDDVSCSLFPAC
ncbi:MAG: hypothetical protein AAF517_09280 [Planctomycetota bacterium]